MASGKLHIAMYPWFASGHMIPFVNVANELAARGHRSTILVPGKALPKLQPLNLHPDLITFVTITVPHVDGLPEGAETANDVTLEMNHLISDAMVLTRPQVEQILAAEKPDLVFHDFAFWIPQVAKPLGIQSLCFLIVSATSMAFNISFFPDSPRDYPSSTVVIRPEELMAYSAASDSKCMAILNERLGISMRDCDVLAIRTCRELEGKFCDYIEAYYRKPFLLTGYALPEDRADERLEPRWAEWLGRFEPGSVVYCALGSHDVLDQDQFREMMLGFELAGMPFFAALKPPAGCETLEEALPEGFAERVEGRGVVYGGWVQQMVFLRHPSVVCFVSHGGQGSMWEALTANKQMVLVPHLGDQVLTTRLLSTDLKIAVEVKREPNMWFSKESLAEAIRSATNKNGDLAALLKKNRDELAQKLTQPGFSTAYTDRFVRSLEELVSKK